MKTCLCCRAVARAEVRTCEKCGEGSWSAISNPIEPVVENSESKVEPSDKPIATDPETVPEILPRRRGKRPS